MKFNIILLIMKSIIFCVTKETIAGSVKAKNHWFTAIFISQIKKWIEFTFKCLAMNINNFFPVTV